MSTITLPGWWQVMPPHRDIRNARWLDESIFAADLGQVVRSEAPEDYLDPVRFFAGTYLTQGLEALLSDVLREMAGQGAGNRVIQIETPFGGGKTHTLLALYHLIKNREAVRSRPEIANLLAALGLESIPDARISTIAGTDLSTVEPVVKPDGTTIHTLWGHVAYDLSGRQGYERVRKADESRIAPGADALRQLFAMSDARVILMDELVTYIVPAEGVPAEDVRVGASTTLKDQTITFLHQLTQAVSQTPRTMLLLTIPDSQVQLYGQAAQNLQQQLFTAAGQIAEVVGRIQTVRTPVQGDDIYEVLRRRLLEPLRDEASRQERDRRARQVAVEYIKMYRSMPHDVPQEVQEQAYLDRMMRAYPFHPDVVRILYERWGTLPDFQRTRGALRILGMVLADLYANNRRDPLILPSHLNLAPGDLRNELVRILDNPAFNNVLDSDIAGNGAKAIHIDAGIGREHARFQPAVRTATTIFLWSFTGSSSETRGATEAQIRVGVLTPDMQPAIVGNVLNEFRRRLWYLHEENNTYRFDTRANLNRVIVQKEEGVTAQAAQKLVETKITEMIGGLSGRGRGGTAPLGGLGVSTPANVRTFVFPKNSGDVADIPVIGVVLLRPSQHAPAGDNIDDLPPLVSDILHHYNDRPRENRNVLVVLVPDSNLVAEAERAARRLLALQAAAADTQLALPANQRNELTEMLSDANKAFPQEVARIYRSVVIPADAQEGGLERFDLGLRSYINGTSLWDDAFSLLAAKDRYLESLAPSLLASDHFRIWPRGADAMSMQKLWEAFVQFPHLPMLANKQVLVEAIAAGCNSGLLGYAVSDESGPPFSGDTGRFGTYNQHIVIEIAPTTWVMTATYARDKLIPRDNPIREIPSTMLVDPSVWPMGSRRRRLEDVWTALVNHYSPQPIDNRSDDNRMVLVAAIYEGLGQNLFRISIDGNEPTTDGSELDIERLRLLTGVELVRPETTQQQKTRLLTIDVSSVDVTQLSKIVSGVIVPLKSQGAKVVLHLVIDADAPGGIDQEVIDLTIKETFRQLDLSPHYEQS
jgi:hypothetical protein